MSDLVYQKMMKHFTGPKKFCNGFVIGQEFARGGYGALHWALHIQSKKVFVAKLELVITSTSKLENEFNIYQLLGSYVAISDSETSVPTGLPRIYNFMHLNNGPNALVMEPLGLSLFSLFRKCGYKFSMKTVLSVALQLIDRMEYIHSKGIVHRDIKLENLVIGRGNSERVIHIIDFGLSAKIQKIEPHQPIPRDKPVGTEVYMSINCLKSVKQTERDDMESIFYLILFMMNGQLPWDKKNPVSFKALQKRINARNEIPEDIPELVTFLEHIRNLSYAEIPNYDFLKKLIKDIWTRKQFDDDMSYDWSKMDFSD